MKRCSYCGREYADDVDVCAVDGRLVIAPGARPEESVPLSDGRPAFDVRLVSPMLSAGKYRVFAERSDLLFIQTEGGSKSILAAVAPLLGPFGNFFPLVLWLFTIRQTKAKRRRLENKDPEELLHESGANFKLNVAEIRDAAVELPSRFVALGKTGRLNLTVRHGEKIKCEFENAAEMSKAIHLLVPMLNSTLRVKVTWDGERQCFKRKK